MAKTQRSVKRALLSVSDKTNILELAHALNRHKIELISTGGTAKLLQEANIPVIDISTYTGFPEIMEGRVKTLHPKVHAGILGRRGIDDDLMSQQAIPPIDLVVVNLYPFAQTIEKKECTWENAIENIDIGGPTMIRAAAKNHHDIAVVINPEDYQRVIKELEENNNAISYETRLQLAAKAFSHTANYEHLIARYFEKTVPVETKDALNNDALPTYLTLKLTKNKDLRYGENPHQKAAFYHEENAATPYKQWQGKALSYNNILDTEAALDCIQVFNDPACVIVKHANPCGIAVAKTIAEAYENAYKTDPTSAFGGIIAFNHELDDKTARHIIDNQFVEIIIAPEITAPALKIFAEKKNVRVLTYFSQSIENHLEIKHTRQGFLIQERDHNEDSHASFEIVSQRKPSTQEYQDAIFAWKVVRFVKSNAIVFAKENRTIGIGAGQMSRVDSAKIATFKAQQNSMTLQGATMASDAFLPFRDSVDIAAKSGISCIIQPGGSLRDQEVIQAANEQCIAMIFTAKRHFRH